MTKAEAIELFGSPGEVALALGITPAAVSQWPDDRIPELRELQIRALKNLPLPKPRGAGAAA